MVIKQANRPDHELENTWTTSEMIPYQSYYLITFLNVRTYYRSWPRLICNASYISYSAWLHRMSHSPLSQKGPWILRRIFLSKTPNACSSEVVSAKSQHHIIKPAETYINKSSFSKGVLFYSIAFLAQSNIY